MGLWLYNGLLEERRCFLFVCFFIRLGLGLGVFFFLLLVINKRGVGIFGNFLDVPHYLLRFVFVFETEGFIVDNLAWWRGSDGGVEIIPSRMIEMICPPS